MDLKSKYGETAIEIDRKDVEVLGYVRNFLREIPDEDYFIANEHAQYTTTVSKRAYLSSVHRNGQRYKFAVVFRDVHDAIRFKLSI